MSGKEKLAIFREACFDDSNMSKEVITIETLIAMLMEMNVDVSQEVLESHLTKEKLQVQLPTRLSYDDVIKIVICVGLAEKNDWYMQQSPFVPQIFEGLESNVAEGVQKWLLRMKTSWMEEFEKYWDESVEQFFKNSFGSADLDSQMRSNVLKPWRNAHAAAILETFIMRKEKEEMRSQRTDEESKVVLETKDVPTFEHQGLVRLMHGVSKDVAEQVKALFEGVKADAVNAFVEEVQVRESLFLKESFGKESMSSMDTSLAEQVTSSWRTNNSVTLATSFLSKLKAEQEATESQFVPLLLIQDLASAEEEKAKAVYASVPGGSHEFVHKEVGAKEQEFLLQSFGESLVEINVRKLITENWRRAHYVPAVEAAVATWKNAGRKQ